jgi:hypothetical protein
MDMTPTLALAASGKVALLVDGENLSAGLSGQILEACRKLGDLTVRRVYGKAEYLAAWEQRGFRGVHCGSAKNSADLTLCVDAMTFALRDGFAKLVIASSDADFAPLAVQLREMGFLVVGIGEAKSGLALRGAYSQFVEMRPCDRPVQTVPTVPPALLKTPVTILPSPVPLSGTANLDKTARRLCHEHGGASKTVSFGQFCHLLNTVGLSRDVIENQQWRTYFKKNSAFVLSGAGSNLSIRPA